MDDQELTRCALAAKRGDTDAATRFVHGTQRQVWQLLRHLADAHVAEDLTQECYLRAFRSLSTYRGRSSARTWLLSIARRVAADHIRHRDRRPRTADIDDWQLAAERVQPRSLSIPEGYALRSALETLDERRREAFVLTQLVGLSYEETAEVAGCRTGTIRSRVARARADLIDRLHEYDTDHSASSGGS
ncbi:RNA polymerase sigma-70 factor, ECF subfamily [Actinopolyspora alba]|uniref:RNA polymerase sigma-70 factor, ECF subfamily n=1 Tax=Actinopolyspora alba TaxID=673379 RepID=A0A1I1Y148_9ACTN|nr:sigma-70 family RNA polymerase sigma factor [Actinopolyspora alba]SFE13415.1 RNA polymerase sigma-70 factor, ECF subfamily [Actinopolyspora alba]